MINMDIGIDLGTSNVLIYVRGLGVVVNQPSVIAYQIKTKTIIAVGDKAKQMLGRTPEEIEVVKPLKQGVISDYTLTERMLKAYIKMAMEKKKFFTRPSICVCVPSNVTEVERRAVEDAVYRIGAKKVYVMEEPLASAIGSSINVSDKYGRMVVDIGGGTTDIAIISAGGIVQSSSLKIAGGDFDEALIRYARRKYNLLIGENMAEEVKHKVGSVYPKEQDVFAEMKGRDLINGLPVRVKIKSSETIEAYNEITYQILDAIHAAISDCPPELVGDISEDGIYLSGGGSLIYGLDLLIEDKLGIKAKIVNEALEAVAIGAGNSVNFVMTQED